MLHEICEFYKKIYTISPKIPKKDRFTIYLKIENICLALMILITEAALETRYNKLPILNTARIKIEVLKRLIRITRELKIIKFNDYINLESDLQKISKMTNGWIKYLEK